MKENNSVDKIRKKILLVEDSKSNRELFSIILDDIGYEVEAVEDGSFAVDAFESNEYDMILMDCEMPVMNGFNATRQIRILEKKLDRSNRTPIIALSARALEEDKKNCFEAGMDDYIKKPVSLGKFSAILGDWFDKIKNKS